MSGFDRDGDIPDVRSRPGCQRTREKIEMVDCGCSFVLNWCGIRQKTQYSLHASTRPPVVSIARLPAKRLRVRAVRRLSDASLGESAQVNESLERWRKLAVVALFGVVAGLAGSMAGLGGAFVLTPLLTEVLGINQRMAQGTSLIAVALVCFTGSLSYLRHGMLSVPMAAAITVIMMSVARVASLYAQKVDEKLLKRYFAIFLIFGAVMLISKNFSTAKKASTAVTAINLWSPRTALFMVVAGVAAGGVSGLLGVGGGTILVPSLSFGVGLSQQVAQGTSLAAGFLPSLVGSFTYATSGNLRPELLLGILPGILVGSIVGSNLAVVMPERLLRTVCASLLLFTGSRTLLKARANAESNSKSLARVAPEGFLFGSEGKVHYRVVGQSDTGAAPLLLLHMAPRSMDEFAEFVTEFEQSSYARRPIIMLDLPGYGTSVRNADVDMSGLASFLWKCLNQLHVNERIDIFGHLLGAHIGLAMAAVEPKRVGKLVLADPIYLDEDARAAVAQWAQANAEAEERDAEGKFLQGIWARRAAFTPVNINYRCFFDELRAQDSEHTLSYSVSKTPLDEILAGVTTSTKIIWAGKTTEMFDAFGWRVSQNIPKIEGTVRPVRVVDVPEAGLDALCSHGPLYVEQTLEFIDGADGSAGDA